MRERFAVWVREVSHADSNRRIGERMGTHDKDAARHLQVDPPTVGKVFDFARAYGVSPVPGLLAAGLLAEDDITPTADDIAIRRATERRLLAELDRRFTLLRDVGGHGIERDLRGGKPSEGLAY